MTGLWTDRRPCQRVFLGVVHNGLLVADEELRKGKALKTWARIPTSLANVVPHAKNTHRTTPQRLSIPARLK